MKRYQTLLASFAIVAASVATASADCAADIAQLTGVGGGIAKDGSQAPLQTDTAAPAAEAPTPTPDASADAASETAAGEGIAKDGSLAPLEGAGDQDGQAAGGVAMSAQDAQAQSQGGDTAAAQAAGEGDITDGSSDRAAALERAQEALALGDESLCLEAVEEARAL